MSQALSKTFRICFTSDTHGHFFPVDYATGAPHATGLFACCASFEKDENTLVIDAGDTLQGSPFAAYVQQQWAEGAVQGSPMAQALNYAGCDYIVPGNHDFNFGSEYLASYINNTHAACLCANLAWEGPAPAFAPTAVHTLGNGLRVGLVGVVTDHVNVWEKPAHLQGLTVSDPFPAAQAALDSLRGRVDVTVCVYHGGFECDLDTDQPLTHSTEHVGSRIARALDFDLLLTGHQHRPIEGRALHGTYVVQPAANAVHYIEVTGTVCPHQGKATFASRFVQPAQIGSENLPAPLQALEAATQQWLDMPVGHLARPLPVFDKVAMVLQGAPVADLFNQVQLAATGAQISCAALSNVLPGFETAVSMRHILANYPYSDPVHTLQITGAQLKEALERTASYLDIDSTGQPVVSPRFLQPKVEHYNYDYFAGLTYLAELHNPVGQRIMSLAHNGQPIQPTDSFTICMVAYRATGTGGYDVYCQCPNLGHTQATMGELLAQYIAATPYNAVQVPTYPPPTFIF